MEWAEDHMGTEESDRLFRLASVLAARELGGVETHGASHSPGTQVALFQKALSLMEKWAREGSLMPRAEHPDWFLTEQEHRLYQRMTPATMASGHNV
ncbi:hypothetical protein ACIPJU_01130 [Micrococcus endophyticus]|uniref:hypothetical protein n=1 Tax=Micrococcus endophyticus TaxID=455343 RepID=UPI00380E15D4